MKLADLLNEFNVVIDTAEGLTELRSLILGLAVRGKLIPKDPNEEPASILLDKIVEKRSTLHQEGKIRKPKKLSSLSEDELPFSIPDTWIWTRLGNIFEIGSSSRVHKKDWKDKGVPFLRAREIVKLSKNGFVDNDLFISNDLYESLTEDGKIPELNDFMITGVGTIGVPYIVRTDDKFYFKDASVLIFKNFFSLYPNYLFYLFKSPLWNKIIHEGSMGTTVHTFTITRANNVPIPFPPVEEQHRIVQKIESLFVEVDELEEKLERQTKLDDKLQLAINAEVQQAPVADASQSAWTFITSNFDTLYHTPEAIDNLKKNILNEAVRGRLVPQNTNDEPASELLKKIEAEKKRLYHEGEIRKPKKLPPVKDDEIPFEIPGNWDWVRLGQISVTKGGKRVPKGYSLTKDPTEYIYLRVSDMQDGTIIDTDLHFIDEKTHEQIVKYKISSNDIYMTIVGATIGKCGLIPERFSGSNLTENAVKITPIIIGKDFLYQLLDMPLSQEQFIDKTKQVGVQKMAIFRLKNTLLTLPPLEEQHRIVQRIEELFAICDRYKAQLEQRQQVNEWLVKGLVGEVLEGVG